MKRAHLEHIIRAAASIAGDDDLVIVGSQAILGTFPDAPAELVASMDADLYPRAHPERSELIDGSIGELSPFHDTFGYYAHGVGPDTATLPSGWEDRLVPIRNQETRYATGWCLEVHDLLVSKLVAGRPKDLAFVRAALRHRLAHVAAVRERASMLPGAPAREVALARVGGLAEARAGGAGGADGIS